MTTCKRLADSLPKLSLITLTNCPPKLSLKTLSLPETAGYQVGRIYRRTCQYPAQPILLQRALQHFLSSSTRVELCHKTTCNTVVVQSAGYWPRLFSKPFGLKKSEFLPKGIFCKFSLQIETLVTPARARGRAAGPQRIASVGCAPPKLLAKTWAESVAACPVMRLLITRDTFASRTNSSSCLY